MHERINVTKTYLPPIDEYFEKIDQIWQTGHLTNNGPFVIELEERLRKYLGVKHFFFVTNGTIALQIALKALGINKEVITTPFSYVATTSSIAWEGATPVFADIDKETLCINPSEIERKITKNTQAIMGVHVYGNPCDVVAIDKIAKKHKLKTIYDAAHAFGVEYNGKSVLKYGDISTLSFHATKLFHTIEGGAVITNDDEIAEKISYMRNFGHNGPENFFGIGINGKNCEFRAAMGLSVLPHINEIIASRENLYNMYKKTLGSNKQISFQKISNGTKYNFSYFPIIFDKEETLLRVVNRLNNDNIYPRRYFYPSLNQLNYVNSCSCPNSESISQRVLCLPLYPGLNASDQERIVEIVNNAAVSK